MASNHIRLGFKYKLRLTGKQEREFIRYFGHARYTYNSFIDNMQEDYQEYLEDVESRLIFGEANSLKEAQKLTYNQFIHTYTFNYRLTPFKGEHEFLYECPSQVLQQKLQDLCDAYKKFFKHEAGYPQYKKKGIDDSIRFPQGFTFDEENSIVDLPIIGKIKYRNSRDLVGTPKSITITRDVTGWYMSVLCDLGLKPEIDYKKLDINSLVGIDMGVKRFATLSTGEFFEDLQVLLKPIDEKIIKLQKRIKHKVKGSKRLKKAYKTIAKLQKKKADIRRDFIQKLSTQIVNNHDIVIVEDLKITNMTKSAKGTIEEPGKNVKQKSGLNRAILSEGWSLFFKCLEYKLENKGGVFKKVSPKHTSQKCSCCGHISKDNRKTQANFKCVKCGYEDNADENASVNIAQAGHAWIARLYIDVNFFLRFSSLKLAF